MKKQLSTLGLSILLLVSGCNNNVSSSSTTSSSTISSSSSSSSVFKGYVDLADAYSNTINYGLQLTDRPITSYAEIYTDQMFYFDITRTGFVELDSDLGYLHSFTTKHIGDDNTVKEMVLYGRVAPVDYLKELELKTIKALIAQNLRKFDKKNENTYLCTDYTFIHNVSDYFQTKMYKYATEIEITVGKDDKLEFFRIIEGTQELLELEFKDVKYQEVDMYKRWVDSGSFIDERIYDYKSLIEVEEDVISIYEGEEVEVEATVNAIDAEGNIYIAKRNDEVGHIGIKVVTSQDVSNIKIKDIVKVKGKIRTKNLNTYISNATVEDTGVDAKYAPIFDEDGLVDSMGGGAYAANLFLLYPQFGDSVYSTYAYVNKMTTDIEKDVVVDVVCPSQVAGEEIYHMEITIPKELPLEKREALFNELQKAGKYGEENAYELNLQNFLMRYDGKYLYRIKLEATADSNIIKRPTLEEKIINNFALDNFPLPECTNAMSYYFGGFSNQFLETEYGLEGEESSGLFIGFQGITKESLNNYLASLEGYNAAKYDEMKDIYGQRHYIYQKNNINIDFKLEMDSFEEGQFTMYMWMYEGTLLKPSSIQENLDSMIGSWFDVNNFVKLSGTYDADYEIYKLRDYAGKSFSEDAPLYCVTLDVTEEVYNAYLASEDGDVHSAYNNALKEMGYTMYRVNNKPYTYTSRGQTHYVWQKDGVFADVAMYPTTDYTYTGHDEFLYRLEILIYTGEPMSVTTYDDLSVLQDLYKDTNRDLAYEIDLPEDAVVEVWRNLGDYKLAPVTYGFGHRDEAFIYTDYVEEAYEACKEGVLEAGYKVVIEKENSILFSKTVVGISFNIFVLKEADKGYVRFMNDIGGLHFYR